MSVRRCWSFQLASLGGVVGIWLWVALGCQADAAAPEKKDPEQKAEAPAEAKPVVDQKIASAMAAARASAESREGGSQGAPGAPPQDGILGEEGAQRELPVGSAAQLVLGAEGSAPRLKLGVERLAVGAGPAGTLTLSYRSAGGVMPTVEIELRAKSSVGAEASGTTSPPAAADSLVTRFAVVGARLAADQPGRLPENARAEIAKLKGSWVDLVSDTHGALQSQRLQVAGNNRGIEPLVQGSAVALASLALPYPEVPVGVGAYWMVKSRESAEGADVVAYRMVKVTELTPSVARLSVNTRRYLITPRLALEGLPPHRVRQFQSEGSATLSLPIGAAYPSAAEIKDHFATLVSPDERPQQAVPVQSELTAKYSAAAP